MYSSSSVGNVGVSYYLNSWLDPGSTGATVQCISLHGVIQCVCVITIHIHIVIFQHYIYHRDMCRCSVNIYNILSFSVVGSLQSLKGKDGKDGVNGKLSSVMNQ